MNLTDILTNVEHFEDQVIVGETRVANNIRLGLRIVAAAKVENLGDTTNEILGGLEVIGKKALRIVAGGDVATPTPFAP